MKHAIRIAVAFAGFLPALAFAHPGHGLPGIEETSSFAAGVLHPLGGADHLLPLILVGMLAASLNGRYLWPSAAAFLGLLVAAWTTDSEGWRYAAGFMLASAALIAAAMAAMKAATRRLAFLATAGAQRLPT